MVDGTRDQLDGLEEDTSIDIDDIQDLHKEEKKEDHIFEENTTIDIDVGEFIKPSSPMSKKDCIKELTQEKLAAGVPPEEISPKPPMPVMLNLTNTAAVPTITNNATSVVLSNIQPGGQLSQILANPAENDLLVNSLKEEESSQTVLNTIMLEIAEEAAYLKAWRAKQWATDPGSSDLSEATHRRIKMLSDLVETLMKKERLNKEKDVGKIDFYGDNFKKVMKHFLQVISDTFKKVHIPSQYNDIFFAQLAKEFDGFEKKAEKIYYNKPLKK